MRRAIFHLSAAVSFVATATILTFMASLLFWQTFTVASLGPRNFYLTLPTDWSGIQLVATQDRIRTTTFVNGQWQINYATPPSPAPPEFFCRWYWRPNLAIDAPRFLGFGWGKAQGYSIRIGPLLPTVSSGETPVEVGRVLSIPYWFVLAFTLPMPIWWIIDNRRRARSRRGQVFAVLPAAG